MRYKSPEHELREAAIARVDGACAILADFYEASGQLSRAALWRSARPNPKSEGDKIPDLLALRAKNPLNHSQVDPRRNAMIWLLYSCDGVTAKQLSGLFGISAVRIKQIVRRIDRFIEYRCDRIDIKNARRAVQVELSQRDYFASRDL